MPVAILGLAGILALHLFPSGMSWGWDSEPGTIWQVGALVVALPLLCQRPWASSEPCPSVNHVAALALLVVLWVAFAVVGNAFPAPPICPDTWYFRSAVRSGEIMARWGLTVWAFSSLGLHGLVELRAGNALLTAVAFVAMTLTAREIARDRRE